MDLTISDVFKACTLDWSDNYFLEQHALLEVVEKLKERAEFVVTNTNRHKLELAESDALAARERYLRAELVRRLCTDIKYSLDCNEDLQHEMEGSAKEFLEQFKDLKNQLFLAESPLRSLLLPIQLTFTQEFMAAMEGLLLKELLNRKSELLEQLGDICSSTLKESVLSKQMACGAMMNSIFKLEQEYVDCESEFQKVCEDYLTLALSMPVLDEKQHNLFKTCEEIFGYYFFINDELDEERYFSDDRFVENLIEVAAKKLEQEVEEKKMKLEIKEAKIVTFQRIWSPKIEDMILSYKMAVRSNQGLTLALNVVDSDSD